MLTFKKWVEEKEPAQETEENKEQGRKKTRSIMEAKEERVLRKWWHMLLRD